MVSNASEHVKRRALIMSTPWGAPGARGVESGSLAVNSHSSVRYHTPFGGFKQPGLGREPGPDAVDALTQTKNVFIATEI